MILFIVNERSGNGKGKKAWIAVEQRMRELGRPSDYIKIAVPDVEDAVRKAEALALQGSIRSLVAVGGDGTLHALLPLAVRSGLPLGLIPSGSGNDTARAFGLPRDPRAALAIVLDGHTATVDVLLSRQLPSSLDKEPPCKPTCSIDVYDSQLAVAHQVPHSNLNRPAQQLSLTCIATGLDGAVAADVNGSRYKSWCNRLGIGPAAYIIGLFRKLATFKPQTLSVATDGVAREFPRCWLATVANTPTYGGGLRICPSASPADGQMQVCVVHGCSALQLLILFPTVLFGRHVRSRFVTILTGSEISIRSSQPLPAYGDGEQVGSTPFTAAIQPTNQLLILTSCSG